MPNRKLTADEVFPQRLNHASANDARRGVEREQNIALQLENAELKRQLAEVTAENQQLQRKLATAAADKQHTDVRSDLQFQFKFALEKHFYAVGETVKVTVVIEDARARALGVYKYHNWRLDAQATSYFEARRVYFKEGERSVIVTLSVVARATIWDFTESVEFVLYDETGAEKLRNHMCETRTNVCMLFARTPRALDEKK